MRDAWFIARMDIAHIFKSKETLVWLFVMPIVFFWFIGSMTAGMGGSSDGESKTPLELWTRGEEGLLVERVVKRLEDNGYAVERVSERERLDGKRRLLLPEDFSARAAAGETATFRFERVGKGLGAEIDQVKISRAVYGVLADLAATAEAGVEPGAEAFADLDAKPQNLTVEVTSAGESKRIPTGYEQAVPGIMVMFTMIVLLTGGAVLLLIERREGLLVRLTATPISRRDIVLGKWISRIALGFIQITFAMAAGTLLFDVRWGSDLPMVLVVLVAWAGLCASGAMLLGSLARTEGQVIGIGVLTSNVLAALGGCWWPIEITPSWMQAVARVLPTGQAMDALHRLVVFEHGAASALPHVAVLVVLTAIVGRLATRAFRFEMS